MAKCFSVIKKYFFSRKICLKTTNLTLILFLNWPSCFKTSVSDKYFMRWIIFFLRKTFFSNYCSTIRLMMFLLMCLLLSSCFFLNSIITLFNTIQKINFLKDHRSLIGVIWETCKFKNIELPLWKRKERGNLIFIPIKVILISLWISKKRLAQQ